ncbi:MAG: hypothetical protein JWO67_35 [Streptosporangiaceae bacterium]|nr:hypothetical protein [Streptosporangiaceae bacterium]
MSTRHHFTAPARLAGLPWPYAELQSERVRAHAKHDGETGQSMERRAWDDPQWLPVLMEEVGEVAKALCENTAAAERRQLRAGLTAELVQVGAMAAAWLDALVAGTIEDPDRQAGAPPAAPPAVAPEPESEAEAATCKWRLPLETSGTGIRAWVECERPLYHAGSQEGRHGGSVHWQSL